jgi:hypothetical protein
MNKTFSISTATPVTLPVSACCSAVHCFALQLHVGATTLPAGNHCPFSVSSACSPDSHV